MPRGGWLGNPAFQLECPGLHRYTTSMEVKVVSTREVALKDAKSRFSSVVDEAASGVVSVITRYGKPAAGVMEFEEWKRLSSVPSFARLLMSCPIDDLDAMIQRDPTPWREVDL